MPGASNIVHPVPGFDNQTQSRICPAIGIDSANPRRPVCNCNEPRETLGVKLGRLAWHRAWLHGAQPVSEPEINDELAYIYTQKLKTEVSPN